MPQHEPVSQGTLQGILDNSQFTAQQTTLDGGADPYVAALHTLAAKVDQQDNQQLMQTLAAATYKDPNTAGEAQRLGVQVGLGPDVAASNMAEVRRRVQLQDADMMNLVKTSPVLAQHLLNPDFAAVAHDQLDNLSTTEKIFNWVKSIPSTVSQMPSDVENQWNAGQLGYEKSMLGWKATQGNASASDWNRINEIDQQLKTLGPNKTWAGTLSNFAGQFSPMVEHGLAAGAATGLTFGATAAAMGAPTGPADLVIAPSAALSGVGVGFNLSLMGEGIQQARGQSYLDMIDKGIDPHTALTASAGVGLINGALQMGALKIIGHPLEQAASDAFSSAVGDKIAQQLARPTVAKAVSSAMFGAAGRAAAGGVDMGAQDFVSQIGNSLAGYKDTGKFDPIQVSRVADAFINGMVITGVMGGAGSMIGLHADMARAADADRSAKFFTALSDNAADSEVRKRNPNAYENFVAAQADGSGAATTYIDGQKMAEVLHQTGLDPAEVEKAVPGFSKQLIEAQATGGDVEIPTAKFAAHIAGTDLGNAMTEHLRLDPDAMSVSEAKDFNAKVQEMQTEAQRRTAEKMGQDAGFEQSAKVVQGKIYDQLMATKSLPADVARTNATLHSSMIASLAAEAGSTPEEFYEKYKPSIERATEGNSADVETPVYHQAIENIRSVVEAANQPGDQKKWTIYAPASEWLRGVAKSAGMNLDGFDHGIDADAIRHAKNEHGDAQSEASRGQIAITDKDFEKIPQVVNEPDRVVFGTKTKSKGLDAIAYVKRLDDGTIAHVEEVRTGRKRLAATSMWKYPAAMDVDSIAASLHPNVRDDGGRTPSIVVRGPSSDKKALPAAESGNPHVTDRAEPAPTPAGQEAGNAGLSVARNETGVNPAAKDFDAIAGTLPSNARSDGGEPIVIRTDKTEPRVDSDDVLHQTGNSMTGALGEAEKAVSAGKNIKPEMLRWVSDRLHTNNSTLRELMNSQGSEVLKRLVADGAISEREHPQFIDKASGGLNEAGKTFVEKALLGTVINDPRLMESAPKSIIGKLERALGSITAFSARKDEWNILPALRAAVGELGAIQRAGSTVELWTGQTDRFGGERNPVVDTMIRALDAKPNPLRAAFSAFAHDSEENMPGQTRMSGKADAFDAFNHAFGGKLTEQEYHDGLDAAKGTTSGQQGQVSHPAEVPSTVRGGFDPSRLAILMGKKADFSTFAHESAHYYLHVLADMAAQPEASDRIKGDMGTLLKWFGVKDLDTWHDMSLADQAKFHEQFAYSFEKYLADGKAPTEEMRGVFDRFSRWIKRAYGAVTDHINSIYKQQHGVDLPDSNDEVKQVMDRMTASDEQIKQAEAQRHMEPIFKEKPDTMNDGEWAAYQEMGREASEQGASKLTADSIRQMQWLSNAKGRMLKELQGHNDALRSGVRDEVAGEVAKDPVYKALDYLKTGMMTDDDGNRVDVEGSHKLNRGLVERMAERGGEGLDVGSLKNLISKDGEHPDLMAERLGFGSGDELVRSLAGAKPIKDEIDARTDQRMLEKYGDMNDPESISREVDKALHNEARQRFVAVELRHLQNATTPVRVMTKAADAAAERMIADKPIGEINPRDYSVSETRSAKAAEEAMKRGDSEVAARAKQNQLIQHSLAKVAGDVQDETEKTLKYLGKFDRPKLAMTKAIGADYMDRINELLAGYSLSKRDPVGQGREDISSWVRSEYDKNGIMPAVSDELIASMGRMHWKDMNIEQVRDLKDAVESLDYIGRKRKIVEMDGKQRDVEEIVSAVRENMAGVKHTDPVDLRADMAHAKGLDKIATQFLNAKSVGHSIDAALIKMEQLFQWLDAGKDAGLKEAPVDGPMQSIFHMAANAEAKERGMRFDSAEAMRELGEKLKGSKIDLNEKLDVPELPRRGTGTKWYREELLAMALNMGNESNKEKLLTGYLWSEERANSAINRLLSKPELDFVQGVWDHIGSYADGIKELQRRQTGITPKMIEPSELSTNHGTYPGGYYPVVYDDFQDRNIEQKYAANADKLFENNYARPSTSKGHTIERTKYNGPIYLSLGVIARHLDQVTHDLAWREPIADMNKVLSHEGLHDEIDQTYGKEYSKQLRPWLQAMANDKVFNTAGDAAWEKFYHGARSNATMVGLGFRLSTMEIHGLSALSNSLGEVGPKWFAKGAAQFAGFDRIQATRNFVYERSPEMANRMNTFDRNVHEAIDDINRRENSLTAPGAGAKVLDGARKFAFYGVSMLDMASAMPTWMGAYLKGMAKEADGGLNLSEADAIENANRAVRNAHGGGGVKDMAAVQRSKGVMSMATMFYSFWNHMYNRQRDIGKGVGAMATGQGSVHDMPRLLARSFFYFAVPQMIHAVLAGGVKKEDESTLDGFLGHLGKEMGLGFVSGVPVLRDLASACANGRDYTITPLEQAGKSIVTAARDATHLAEGEPTSKHAFTNSAQAAGYTFGIPSAQPAATTKFLWDVMDGEQSPQDLADWWKGIQTGKIQ